MKREEAYAIIGAVFRWGSRNSVFLGIYGIYAALAVFAFGPITEAILKRDDWLLWTLGAVVAPLVLVVLNAPVAWLRSTDERKRRRLDSLRQRADELERELQL